MTVVKTFIQDRFTCSYPFMKMWVLIDYSRIITLIASKPDVLVTGRKDHFSCWEENISAEKSVLFHSAWG